MDKPFVSNIKPHPSRKALGRLPSPDPALADKLRTFGADLIPPLVVRPGAGHWELLSGERYWLAAAFAGIDEVPYVVRDDLDEDYALELVKEDAQSNHSQMNPMALARAAQRLVQEDGVSYREAGRKLGGLSKAAVGHHLRLLQLNEDVQDMVESGLLSLGKAKVIARLPLSQQKDVAMQVQGNAATVRDTEALVSGSVPESNGPATATEEFSDSSSELAWIENAISTQISIPVKMTWQNGVGTLTFTYNNLDVLDGLLRRMNIQLEDDY